MDALPEELAELYRGLEDTLLEEICSRLRIADQLNEVTVQDIRALRSHGIPLEDIKKAIAQTNDISMEKLDKLFDDVVARNQAYYTELIDLAHVTAPETLVDHAAIYAIYEQTRGELRNITRSMGFMVRDGRGWRRLTPAKSYQWALDRAVMEVESGAISYNQAISRAVKELAGGGLKIVDFESGVHRQIDSHARTCVMTGVNQLNQKYREQSMDYLGTDLVEVTAHIGARNTGSGYFNHESWQGGRYHWRKYGSKHRGKYPDFEEECGMGQGGGIGGWNCRHSYWPYLDGIMEPTHSKAELESMKAENHKVTFEGKEYDGYTSTQQQRRIEREIRKQKRVRDACKATGLKEDTQAANIKLRRLNEEYREFSKAAGLPEQRERLKVLYGDDASRAKAAKRAGQTKKVIESPRKMVEKQTGYRYNKDGTIVVTHDLTGEVHPRILQKREPFSVVDTLSQSGRQRDRTYYDKDGLMIKQISNGPHGNPKEHPFGEHGEHAHDIIWKDGKIVDRPAREVTEKERKENGDIL